MTTFDIPAEVDAEFLERLFGTPENYAGAPDANDEEHVFPDGTPTVFCTNWATYVRRVMGDRATLHGFFSADNPESRIGKDNDGHDFAIVDDRYLVDGWALDMNYATRAVFDLQGPQDVIVVMMLYGDRGKWQRNTELEASVDAETAEIRQKALAGTDFHLALEAYRQDLAFP